MHKAFAGALAPDAVSTMGDSQQIACFCAREYSSKKSHVEEGIFQGKYIII